MDKAVETAVEAFNAGYNCAQAVALAFSDKIGVDKDLLLKMSAGFGAGMGRKQEICGAVSGGLMVLGLAAGATRADDIAGKEAMYTKVNQCMDRFKETLGSYSCFTLLEGSNLNTDAGKNQFKARDLRNTVCVRCVREASAIVAGFL